MTEVNVDAQGRVPLSFRRHKQHTRYHAEETPDGIIVLTPAAGTFAKTAQARPPRKEAVSLDEAKKRMQEYWEHRC